MVLLDGLSLEAVGQMLEDEGLCKFVIGLYFVCNPGTGARRTLGYANTDYEDLDDGSRVAVDELIAQIIARNEADRNREVQPIARPSGAPIFELPSVDGYKKTTNRFMATIDTSAKMTKKKCLCP